VTGCCHALLMADESSAVTETCSVTGCCHAPLMADESSAATETCSVTGCCHALLTADCSTLWARGRRSCAGTPTSVLF